MAWLPQMKTMSLLFMNAESKVIIKSVSFDGTRLASFIHGAIGNPLAQKILEGTGS
jgi:hypothetical protein